MGMPFKIVFCFKKNERKPVLSFACLFFVCVPCLPSFPFIQFPESYTWRHSFHFSWIKKQGRKRPVQGQTSRWDYKKNGRSQGPNKMPNLDLGLVLLLQWTPNSGSPLPFEGEISACSNKIFLLLLSGFTSIVFSRLPILCLSHETKLG